MESLDVLPDSELSHIEGLCFDLDDTFLDDGRLLREAYDALCALDAGGIACIVLTGRPASWAEQIVRMWPVRLAIAENGALCFERKERIVRRIDSVTVDERRARKERLARLVHEVREQFPDLEPADDTHGRVSDFTFDIGEHHRASEIQIVGAQATVNARGGRTTRSSIHLHLTFDQSDKASGAVHFLARLGWDTTAILRRFAFIGDSENDAACFAAFKTSIAVANLTGTFRLLPRYKTHKSKSEGFIELAEKLLRARG